MLDPFRGRGLLVLLGLLSVSILNFVDRNLPFILVEPIRRDLHLTDGQIGLMAGVTFAVVYSFATLLMGWLADRSSPRIVIAATLAVWSIATAFSGLAQNFSQLILARIGVAAGESGTAPAAHALIARNFLSEKRGVALALFAVSVSIGSMAGLFLGGWINDALGWREAFLVVGAPGVVVAIGVFFILPKASLASSADGISPPDFMPTLSFLFRRASYRHMVMASSLFAIGSYAMSVFLPAFLMRVHHLTAAQTGVALALASGLGGILGAFTGGVTADWLGRRAPMWRQLIPAIAMGLSAPIVFVAFLTDDATICLACLTVLSFLGLMYYAPTFAAAQLLVSDAMRATTAAILLFFLTLLGSSIGPYVIGRVSDGLKAQYGDMSLRYAFCLLAISLVWSAAHFLLAARSLPKDIMMSQEATLHFLD